MQIGNLQVDAVLGDITRQRVDAVVNAASSALLGGGGVDGAIHAAAGPALLAECREVRETLYPRGLPTGEAVPTAAGLLRARWVIHTVGPDARAGETDPALLASCFARSLDVAAELGAESVAFPAVSAGVFGWPAADVAQIAVVAVRDWVERRESAAPPSVALVRFVLFSPEVHDSFERALSVYR